MTVTLSRYAGFCGGVKRAVDLTEQTFANHPDKQIYIYGELVHNRQVTNYFQEKGLIEVHDIEDFQRLESGIIIIRAHGVTRKEIDVLSTHSVIVDTTCKFVKSIHNKVEEFSNKGYNIVVVGDPNHPEVKGIAGWSKTPVHIVHTLKDVENLKVEGSLYCVSQTTFVEELFLEIISELQQRYEDVVVYNSICNATTLRQADCIHIAEGSDVMFVIGGLNSANTNKLALLARQYAEQVFHIQTSEELAELNLEQYKNKKIGITAGASTPDWIIKEVVMTMNEVNGNEMSMEVVDNSFRRIHRGEIITGEVIYVNENEVMVNINYKSDGIISRDELSNDPQANPREMFKQGDNIDVYVLKVDDGDGNVVLSYKRVTEVQVWDVLAEKFESGESLECKVVNPIKGGLSVLVEGLNAFMPASQVSLNYIEDFSAFKGQVLPCKIIDFDKTKRKLVVSKKVIDKLEHEKKVEELWNKIAEGDIVSGTVQRLTDFGAFVDIGGVDGLVHISDLSWNRVRKPSDVVKIGDIVETKILSIDREKNRISLGLKQTMEEPWTVFIRDNKVGDIVEGTVVSLLDFGAFIKLECGVDGLLHVSQISTEHVDKPADVLKIGQTVRVKITEIDEEKRKISLSIRALLTEQKSHVEEQEEQSECGCCCAEEGENPAEC